MRSAVFLVAVTLGSSAGASPRAGKVVRIERKPAGFAGMPRFCTVHPGDMFGLCIGVKAPEVGDRMTAIDHGRVLGTLRVIQVQSYNDGCSNETWHWMIHTAIDSGDVANSRGTVIGVYDVPLDSRHARLINAESSPTAHTHGTDTVYAIDNNADGSMDVAFVQYPCDDFANASTTTPTGQCQEVWTAQPGRGLQRLRHDRFRTCY